ncbi:electron transfer flavoprotein subunit alpha/FixB family protein [Leeia sp. TBRC 13508]|uniref:Electron transfer flavoprotein subunit alpha/FixB family protein n=1 Tax=Leeia speluncae TaxID=2884804 RepID=A0ABS8D8X3_9NEIS|nr:electron transfer flavoprotein subunit alpha/FixB family protein [Leeia speluncae]MCB6184641.1 electron transfer flavoprotein subunit alpha/FixB family protein [Leeia speluncae]
MKALIIADLQNNNLAKATQKVITVASALSAEIHVLVVGNQTESAATSVAQINPVKQVFTVEHATFAHPLPEQLTELLVQLSKDYDYVIGSDSSLAKSTLPRLAAKLDVMQLSEITKVFSDDTFERNIYAGNAVQKIQSLDSKKVITVRTSCFKEANTQQDAAAISTITFTPSFQKSQFVSENKSQSDTVSLKDADIVLSGGRGLGSKESFEATLNPLAAKLNAAVGASRAAVDAGYAQNEQQVGQTGNIVSPKIYIAAGISGAIQHLAGMSKSEVVFAINKDEEAPIFQNCDYGVVGDLFDVIKALEAKV